MYENEKFMRLAFEQARLAVEAGNEPFGAVLVKDGEIKATGQNRINTESDPTYHAETGLIRDYCHDSGITDLSGYTLYTSCEPCVMCAGCMIWAKLGRMVYSVSLEQLFGIMNEGPGEVLAQGSDRGIYLPSADVFAHSINKITIIGGILKEEGIVLYSGFLSHQED